MITIREVLANKSKRIVHKVMPQATVLHALELMAEKNVGALMVVENDKLVGIFSERDYARKTILMNRRSDSTHVGDIMTKDVFFMGPENTLEDCMSVMSMHRIRHLPVIENEALIGVVTMVDVAKEIMAAMKSD